MRIVLKVAFTYTYYQRGYILTLHSRWYYGFLRQSNIAPASLTRFDPSHHTHYGIWCWSLLALEWTPIFTSHSIVFSLYSIVGVGVTGPPQSTDWSGRVLQAISSVMTRGDVTLSPPGLVVQLKWSKNTRPLAPQLWSRSPVCRITEAHRPSSRLHKHASCCPHPVHSRPTANIAQSGPSYQPLPPEGAEVHPHGAWATCACFLPAFIQARRRH